MDKTTLSKLLHTKIETCSPSPKLITICETTTPIRDAFKVLIKENISSLPVFNPKTLEFERFVDIGDIVCHVLDIILENEIKEGYDPDVTKEEFTRYKVEQLAGYSDINQFVMIKRSDTLLDSIELFARYGVKRIVVGESADVYSVLTHSYIIQFMKPYIDLFKFSNLRLEEMLDRFDDPVSVSETDPVKTAFRTMKSNGCSGLAVTNHYGQITGNISESDLKMIGFSAENFQVLQKSIISGLLLKDLISVSLDVTVKEAFNILLSRKIHRLYVVQEKRVIRVITYLNLIRLMYEEIKNLV